MAFDFKKEYKELYQPKNKPVIIDVPQMNYVAVRGKGNPNEEAGEYKKAIEVLYAVSYTLKMSYKTERKIEGFWWQDGTSSVDYAQKDTFNWISVIRLPDFVKQEDFGWAVKTATEKKKIDCSKRSFSR